MNLPEHHHDGYDPNCEGCRPVAIDPVTGKLLPDDHPVVMILRRVIETAPKGEQDAYIRVVVKNSRAVADLVLFQSLQRRIAEAMRPD